MEHSVILLSARLLYNSKTVLMQIIQMVSLLRRKKGYEQEGLSSQMWRGALGRYGDQEVTKRI